MNFWPRAFVGIAFLIAQLPFRNAQSQTIQLANGGVRLDWPASSNASYGVQFRSELDKPIWLFPQDTAWPITNSSWTDALATQDSARFYRVLTTAPTARGQLLSTSLIRELTAQEIATLFALFGVPVTPQYGVRVYRIVYETLTPLGAPTRASGAVAVPQQTGAVPLVSYQHGTITRTNEAPSSSLNAESLIGVAFACTGYAAAVPDYLGLGQSPGLHPYHHARSEANACLDLLRATRQFSLTNDWSLNGQLFLCGYSQGGHATMALHREIETFYTNEFTVTASAPMAGAYDLSGVTTDDLLSGRAMPNPYYFAYLLVAYQQTYQLGDLSNFLLAPYATNFPQLLNGNTSGSQINAAMPSDVTQVFRPEVLAAFRSDPNHPLRVALRDNDLHRWTPRAPIQLFHCPGDQDVVFANSQTALESFHARGAMQITLTRPVEPGDHDSCARPSLLLAKIWFDSLRQ